MILYIHGKCGKRISKRLVKNRRNKSYIYTAGGDYDEEDYKITSIDIRSLLESDEWIYFCRDVFGDFVEGKNLQQVVNNARKMFDKNEWENKIYPNFIEVMGDGDYKTYTGIEIAKQMAYDGYFDGWDFDDDDAFVLIEDFLDDQDILYESNFTYYETRGYSQGDYAKVYILDKDDKTSTLELIDQLFWDSPIDWGMTTLSIFPMVLTLSLVLMMPMVQFLILTL